MKKSRKILSGLLMLLTTGCAVGYHEIKPATLTYERKSEDNAIVVEYQTQLLQSKYAANETKTGVMLVGVKIINNSAASVVVKSRLKAYNKQEELTLMPLNSFYELTRQNSNKSLQFLYLLPLNGYTSSQTTSGSTITSKKTNFYPVGIILGPALAFGNKAAADGANKKFKKELDSNNILEAIIPAGQTQTGLVAIRADAGNTALTFKIAK